LIAATLVVVGVLLSVPGSVAAWQERVVLDEDTFVATVDEAFEQEEVQAAIAERLTDEIMKYARIQERIESGLATIQEEGGEDLPEGLVLLTGPLSGAARDVIFQVALSLVEAQPLKEVREGALRAAHRVLTAIVDDDVEALAIVGDDVVLDLGVILEEIIKDIGGEDGEGFLASIDIPEDAGRIVLAEKSDITTMWTLANWLGKISPWVAIAAAVTLALAVAISPHRRGTVIAIGVAIAFVAAISIVVVAEPLKEVTADAIATTASGNAAAKATYDIFVRSFQRQEAFVMLIGVGMAAGGSVAADRHIAAAMRSWFRRPAPAAEEAGFLEWTRERVQALRVAGLGVAALLLITWTDPSTRFVITVLVLTVAYMAALAAATGDAEWAVSIRSGAAGLRDRYLRVHRADAGGAPAGPWLVGWIAARASWFRGIGIVLGVALLIVLPSLTFGTFVLVVTLELLYLAAIDTVVNRVSG
jgi:hypothetical protein